MLFALLSKSLTFNYIKEKRRPRQRSQVHHKPNTDGSGLRQYGHKPISVYVARNYFRGGDSRAFEQSVICSVLVF